VKTKERRWKAESLILSSFKMAKLPLDEPPFCNRSNPD
jgi:hypothetical protein